MLESRGERGMEIGLQVDFDERQEETDLGGGTNTDNVVGVQRLICGALS